MQVGPWNANYASLATQLASAQIDLAEENQWARVHDFNEPTLESGGEDNAPLYGIDMTTHHPSFLALARDTRITDIIAKLIGENIVLQHSKTVHKTPANPEGPRPGGRTTHLS